KPGPGGSNRSSLAAVVTGAPSVGVGEAVGAAACRGLYEADAAPGTPHTSGLAVVRGGMPARDQGINRPRASAPRNAAPPLAGRPGDPSAPRGPAWHLNLADRAHGSPSPAAATRALLTLPAADTTAASEPESRLGHGDHRDPLALHRLAEDSRDHRLLTDRLG